VSAGAYVLEAAGVEAGYGGFSAIRDLDLEVAAGEVVALLGPNGAGKTTTLRVLAGEVGLSSGEVRLLGRPTREVLFKRAEQGLAYVAEDRSVFMRLSVAENLRVGRCSVDRATALFPELLPLLGRRAGLLSGGEQQILTLARALARSPKVLLVDELSLGLAPLVVDRLLAAIRHAAQEQEIGVVLVEQHIRRVLQVADRVCVMQRGRIVLRGSSAEIADQLESVEQTYLSGPG
jgi:branched-chain amino acid transport system ATP-binding protein